MYRLSIKHIDYLRTQKLSMWKEAIVPQNLAGETEKVHKKPLSLRATSGPILERELA
jgi:hypothetical protein